MAKQEHWISAAGCYNTTTSYGARNIACSRREVAEYLRELNEDIVKKRKIILIEQVMSDNVDMALSVFVWGKQ